MRLTNRQEKTMDRIIKHDGVAFILPELAKQLAVKGLVKITGEKTWLTKWNKRLPGTTLWQVRLI